MADRTYEVGRGKPPQRSRFKKGQSGNPAGRPKGSRNLRTDIEAELLSTVTVKENGKPVRVSKSQLLIKSLTAKAITGDVKAAALLLGLMAKLSLSPAIDISATGLVPVVTSAGGPPGASEGEEETDLPEADAAILAAFAARFRAGGEDD